MPPTRGPGSIRTAKPFVRLENVTKKFGNNVLAVDQVSLDIYKGELFCLLGGSGSGKSTLLRMLAGFETPTSGTILIDGQDMAGVPPYRRPVNMMFQSYALFPHMSVEANIAYGLRRDGMPADEIRTRVEEIAERSSTCPATRSAGPANCRAASASASPSPASLAKKPKLLLLDEPLGALDKKLREETQYELVKIQEQTGVTFVVVTHDQEEAMSLATRIGVMDTGIIAQIGEPHEIYEFPNSRFVAGFIGNVNMFEGIVTEDEPDHVRIRCHDIGGDIFVPPRRHLRPRPDALVRHPAGKAAHRPRQAGGRRQFRPWAGRRGRLSRRPQRLSTSSSTAGMRMQATRPNIDRWDEENIRWDEHVYVSWDGAAGAVLTS